ncbi:hypothetical protein KAZ57_01100 [Patescibacteria group bacterium]|nr:hypothetical protein [Patescibacteria group bacterium]
MNNYVLALGITIVIETLIAMPVLGKNKSSILYSVIVNLISHPWAYIAYIYFGVNYVVVEIVVILVEVGLLKKFTNFPLKKCMYSALAMNLGSAYIGRLLYF